MESNNTQDTTTVTETTETPTVEQTVAELRKVAEFRHKTLSQLTSINFKHLCNTLIATNGVSYQQKIQARDEIAAALEAVLDFGLGITGADVKEKGPRAREVNQFAAVLVQALDNRFILLADNMKKQQDAELAATVTEETKETENV